LTVKHINNIYLLGFVVVPAKIVGPSVENFSVGNRAIFFQAVEEYFIAELQRGDTPGNLSFTTIKQNNIFLFIIILD